MAPDKRRNLLLLAGVLSLAVWLVPGLSIVALPLVYLNTHVHELAHAMAALGTGGVVADIQVFASGSGVARAGGGWPLVIASAGYIGASALGALMIALSVRPERAKGVLGGLAVILGISMLLWVRGDLVGLVSGVFWVVLLAVFSAKLERSNAVFAAQFLGMQQCLTSLQALFVLLQISAYPIENDARIAERLSGVPAIVYALTWAGVSLVLMGWALRRAWSGETTTRVVSPRSAR